MNTTSLKYNTSRTIGNTKTTVRIRLNDNHNNGVQDFSIVCDIQEKSRNGIWIDAGGGANHKHITKVFPEFKIFCDLHLCSYKGVPIHCVANGFYHLKNGFTKKRRIRRAIL